MKRKGLWILALLASAVSVAQAQSLSSDQTNYRNDSTRSVNGRPEFRFALFPPGARVRPGLRPYGFSLMPAGGGLTSSTLGLAPMAAGPNLPVVGGGTIGRLSKWTGFTSSNSFIGDSTIFESKTGLVGIGTDTPTSKLTVAGTIQSLSGGFQFPDGTVQTTSASGSLFTVAHDATLTGDGTVASPLGVSVPLNLTGSSEGNEILLVTNTAVGGRGIMIQAGNGGPNNQGFGGRGLLVQGGNGVGNAAGPAVVARGGDSNNAGGGGGVIARGGMSDTSAAGAGVDALGGFSPNGPGGDGVVAIGGNSGGQGFSAGNGIFAIQGEGGGGTANGLAGKFNGDVEINGNLDVSGTKNFKIDHPLDPENKYLIHAAIESSEVLNVYSGNVTTNERGEAVVALPDWFEALNKDLRYQLTVIGTFAQAIVAEKVRGNRFIIRTSAPSVEVSWQVTGVRSDAAMKKQAFKAEQEKPERERGTYLNPEAYGQAEERGVEWARRPELMRQMKARRESLRRNTQVPHQ